jgi:hypothetical protein
MKKRAVDSEVRLVPTDLSLVQMEILLIPTPAGRRCARFN